MKNLGYLIVGLGFFLIIGAVGAQDFYEECRAAVDCVAGEPMSGLQVFGQMLAGVLLMLGGSFWAWIWSE